MRRRARDGARTTLEQRSARCCAPTPFVHHGTVTSTLPPSRASAGTGTPETGTFQTGTSSRLAAVPCAGAAPGQPLAGRAQPDPAPGSTRRVALGALAVAALGLSACSAFADPGGAAPSSSRQELARRDPVTQPLWRTVWQDDFSSGSLDPAVWTPAEHGGNRDLRELQYNDPSMVAIEGGNLVLHARRQDRDGYPYLAGSLSTKGKLVLGPHGRLSTRQYLSPGAGLGVGVCLYGADIDTVGWPACGEIDATEIALGRPSSPFGSVHGPGYSGGQPLTGTYEGPSLVDRWVEHVLEWEPGRISWAIDGEVYHEASSADPRAAGGWPFEQPFFLTVVMTVGSYASGEVDESTWPRGADGSPVDPYAVFESFRFEQRR